MATYRVLAQHPHDVEAFTQGLAVHDGLLLESTGGYGRSRVIAQRMGTWQRRHRVDLPREFFGEGLTVVGERIVQLTWRSQNAFLYSLDLKPLERWTYRGEGWGLAYDGRRLIRSDGSDQLHFHDPRSFAEIGRVPVRDADRAITRLNELEFVDGWLYANVWLTDRIAVIDPTNGTVRAWLDLSALKQRFEKPPGWNAVEHVLNGIAYDPATRHFYVTGKCWPLLFELEIELPRISPAAPHPSN